MELTIEHLIDMSLTFSEPAIIIRTERGLAIAGTRITLYDVMDYVTENYPPNYPPKFIRAMLGLTDEQVAAALFYIETHRAEVETEYQFILKEAEELQQYYEEENRDRVTRIAAKSSKLGKEAIRAKLEAEKARLMTSRT